MKRILVSALLILTTAAMHAQKLALNNDVAMDALMIPNLGVELTCGEKSTFGLHFIGTSNPWWSEKGHGFGVQPEYRYFFSGRPMYGWFAGLGALAGFYDLTIKDKVYDGMTYGAGLTLGYVFKLTGRWNIDVHAGVGCVGYSRKEYYVGDNYDVDYAVGDNLRNNAHGYTLVPTRIGVSFTYILR